MAFHPLFGLSRVLTAIALRISGWNGAVHVLRAASARLGVSAIGASGRLGFVFGSIRDDFVHAAYLQQGTWNPEIQELFDRVFANGGTLIDAGANIGLTSVPIAMRRRVDCHAFEPDPENFRYLMANAAGNGASTVHAYNIALTAQDGSLELERSRVNWGDHRIRPVAGVPLDESQEVIRVEGRRLDHALAGVGLRPPVLLKVDTQGADVQVLHGASGILDRVDFAVCEFWPYGLRRMGESCEAFYEAISPFAFAAILGRDAPELRPLQDVIVELRGLIPQDGSEPEKLVDVFLSRTRSWDDASASS